jgi:amidase
VTGGPTFITRLDAADGDGPRLAVKDNLDVAGTVTTVGSKLIAGESVPAAADAACVAAARRAGARIVGKTNMVELAYGAEGLNPWFGTPVNPVDPARVPGGSSSGSAVAVATGEADVAIGTDTGGSIRIPAACCGVLGLKTTHGRIADGGLWSLAPSLDVIGPMAADVAGLELGMRVLEPGFAVPDFSPTRIGRVRVPAPSWIDDAVDRALARTGVPVVDIDASGWLDAWYPTMTLLDHEASRSCARFLARADELDPLVAERLSRSAAVGPEQHAAAAARLAEWRAELAALFGEFDVLALPTIAEAPPALDRSREAHLTALTAPVNGGGVPALAMPVGDAVPIPVSLQLVGPSGSEERLLAVARVVEGG